jgi:hypothetical protein
VKKTMMMIIAILSWAGLVFAQNKAALEMEHSNAVKAGGEIVLNINLNAPLPREARFDLRISPVAADEEVALGMGEPIDASRQTFRLKGTVPQGALPGEWHVSVIYLFLPGSSWTRTTIAPNDLKFHVEGTAYSLPTKADITLANGDKPK